MSTFHDRMGQAAPWEKQLIERLQGRGWLAAPFGQAQIPRDMLSHLRDWRDDYGRSTLLRWTPDIIAVRPGVKAKAKPFVCLIDAKTELDKNKDTGNYAVEVNAVDAGLAIVRDWHTPLFYVWPDLRVLTPHKVVNRWHRKLDGAGTAGSRTAFYLVGKQWADDARDIFPTCEKVEAHE